MQYRKKTGCCPDLHEGGDSKPIPQFHKVPSGQQVICERIGGLVYGARVVAWILIEKIVYTTVQGQQVCRHERWTFFVELSFDGGTHELMHVNCYY